MNKKTVLILVFVLLIPSVFAVIVGVGGYIFTEDGQQVVSIGHRTYHIHRGDAFFIKNWTDINGAGTIVDFLFIINETEPHAKWEFSGEDEFIVTIYENSTITNNGLEIKIRNNNRNDADASTLHAYVNPTVTALGTELWSGVIGSKGVLSSGSQGEEFLGMREGNYIFRVYKVNSGIHWFDYAITWVEEKII